MKTVGRTLHLHTGTDYRLRARAKMMGLSVSRAGAILLEQALEWPHEVPRAAQPEPQPEPVQPPKPEFPGARAFLWSAALAAAVFLAIAIWRTW